MIENPSYAKLVSGEDDSQNTPSIPHDHSLLQQDRMLPIEMDINECYELKKEPLYAEIEEKLHLAPNSAYQAVKRSNCSTDQEIAVDNTSTSLPSDDLNKTPLNQLKVTTISSTPTTDTLPTELSDPVLNGSLPLGYVDPLNDLHAPPYQEFFAIHPPPLNHVSPPNQVSLIKHDSTAVKGIPPITPPLVHEGERKSIIAE